MSAATKARGANTPLLPLGVAKTQFWVKLPAEVMASVPVPVIGDPLTDNQAGTVIATEVTVPLPDTVAQLPSPLK